MSSRRLRKIQQEKELAEAQRLAETTPVDVEEESEDEPIPTPRTSLFSALALTEGDNEEEESPGELSEDPKPVPRTKKAKKKKKTKPKPKPTETELHDDSDDIEAAIRELNIKNPKFAEAQPVRSELDLQLDRICQLLNIQTEHLKVAKEMRTLFGKTAVGPEERPEIRAGQPVDLETALRGTHAPGKGLSEVILRRNPFIQGKDSWPKAGTGGLTMVMVDDLREKDGTVEFRFHHDETYQKTQQVFQYFVQMGDPQNLITLLHKNPYHVSTLIQVSKIAKNQGDHALSSDLLERALFTFGRTSLSLFSTKVAEGKARLDFARPENREIWLAGYHYIKSLIMKGTYRTAFEWAKLLLSFDPEEDPYGMRLMMHNLALRAHAFEWLLDFSTAIKEDQMRWWFSPDSSMLYHNAPSLAFAALQLRNGVQAREILSKSMKNIPWLFVRLFSAIDLEVPPSIWGIQPRTDAEDMFTDLYIRQTKDLWNTPEATSVLMEVAHTIEKVSAPATKVMNQDMTIEVVRFVYLDDTPALMAFLPNHILHKSNNSDSDPIPPVNNIFSYPGQRESLSERGTMDVEESPFARLFPGLLRRPRGPRDEEEEEEEEDDDSETNEPNENIDAMLAAALEQELENPDRQGAPLPPSLATRLMNMMFGPPALVDEDEDEVDTDTDAEMPELVDGRRYNENEAPGRAERENEH